jgi:hypothetical protein
MQHRVADQRRLAGQHAADQSRALDATHRAGLVHQPDLDGLHGQRAWRRRSRRVVLARRQVVTALRAADPLDECRQLGQRSQHLADALRLAPFAAVQATLQFVPAQARQVTQRLQQRQHLFPALALHGPLLAKGLRHGGDRLGAGLPGGVVHQRVEVPQRSAQHLQRKRLAAVGERGQRQLANDLAQRCSGRRLTQRMHRVRQGPGQQRVTPMRQGVEPPRGGATAADDSRQP